MFRHSASVTIVPAIVHTSSLCLPVCFGAICFHLFLSLFLSALTGLSIRCQHAQTHYKGNCRQPAAAATSRHVTALSGCSEGMLRGRSIR